MIEYAVCFLLLLELFRTIVRAIKMICGYERRLERIVALIVGQVYCCFVIWLIIRIL